MKAPRGIKNIKQPAETPTKGDREAVDFSRFQFRSGNEMQPVRGVSFGRTLEIASVVCKRKITELTQVRSKREMKEIRRRVNAEFNTV